MPQRDPYRYFTKRLKLLAERHPDLIRETLSNIFTMRLVGNKTHGDLAEIAIVEFINQYMNDFESIHVGKYLFRAKSKKEEDIKITNTKHENDFSVSLKAYGIGPLQLSTNSEIFSLLEEEKLKSKSIEERKIRKILKDIVFSDFRKINVLLLIYDEENKQCNIQTFDYRRAEAEIFQIMKITEGYGRKHPIYRFNDKYGKSICEVRYGDAKANALQRGLWTDTRRPRYFDSITNGWISYSPNDTLIELFSHALISSESGHKEALKKVKNSIVRLRDLSGL